jgi:hypothetical protein
MKAVSAFLVLALLSAARADDKDPAPLLSKINSVRNEGQGNPEASAAMKALVAIGPKALLPTLAAMTENDRLANNWLRPAADTIAENIVRARQSLPLRELEAFVRDTKNSGPGRRAAYEWLVKGDSTAPARLLPDMLDDPAGELRRDAVAVLIKKGDDILKESGKEEALKTYRRALQSARDADQVDGLAKKLTDMGGKVDLPSHYGFIMTWQLLTPFDNTAGVGYKASYPPEKQVEPGKPLKGKNGAEARWVEHTTSDVRGLVDLNKVLGNLKGTVVYAYAVVDSPREQKVQLRAGCINAIKIFLNGKQVFGREEYHHGMSMDQHVGFGTLKAGRNEILVKVCQNEQTEKWAQDWKFQLRLCDDLGTAVPFKVVTVKKGEQK